VAVHIVERSHQLLRGHLAHLLVAAAHRLESKVLVRGWGCCPWCRRGLWWLRGRLWRNDYPWRGTFCFQVIEELLNSLVIFLREARKWGSAERLGTTVSCQATGVFGAVHKVSWCGEVPWFRGSLRLVVVEVRRKVFPGETTDLVGRAECC